MDKEYKVRHFEENKKRMREEKREKKGGERRCRGLGRSCNSGERSRVRVKRKWAEMEDVKGFMMDRKGA